MMFVAGGYNMIFPIIAVAVDVFKDVKFSTTVENMNPEIGNLLQSVCRQEKDAWTYFSTIRVWGSTVSGS